jgi:hypothetical protein
MISTLSKLKSDIIISLHCINYRETNWATIGQGPGFWPIQINLAHRIYVGLVISFFPRKKGGKKMKKNDWS